MARAGIFGDYRSGPVAESVDARAMHRSLSWFKSRPGLQPSLAAQATARQASPDEAFRGSPGLPRRSSKSEGGLIGPLRPFRGCGIWSKDHPRARVTWRLG